MLFSEMERHVISLRFDVGGYERRLEVLEKAINEIQMSMAKPEPKEKRPREKTINVVAIPKRKGGYER